MQETHVNTCRVMSRILSNWSIVSTDQSEWMLTSWNQPTGWMAPIHVPDVAHTPMCPLLLPAGHTALSVAHRTLGGRLGSSGVPPKTCSLGTIGSALEMQDPGQPAPADQILCNKVPSDPEAPIHGSTGEIHRIESLHLWAFPPESEITLGILG